MNNIKICNDCKLEKTIEDNFYKQKHGKDGYESKCKDCIRIRRELKHNPVIYKIINIVNNRIYIGQTIKPLTERFSHHVTRAMLPSEGKISTTPLSLDIRKFGRGSFECVNVEVVRKREDLDMREVFWIEYYRKKYGELIYNLDSGGKKDKLNSESTKVAHSRSRGVSEPILVYEWDNHSFSGKFNTIEEISKSLNIVRMENFSENIKKNGFCIKGKHVAIYEYNESSINEIFKLVKSAYYINDRGMAIDKTSRSEKNQGSKNAMAKLDEETVILIIKDLIRGERNKFLVEKYNVSPCLISSINNRDTWSHIIIEGYEHNRIYNQVKKRKKTNGNKEIKL